jgi:uncharacterized protein
MMYIKFPYQINNKGHTGESDYEDHIRELIEQILFTSPGERVNLPSFGTGLQNLVFAPNSPELASATQFLIQSSLQQWLGDMIQIESLQVESEDSTLNIRVNYIILKNREHRTADYSQRI